MNRGRKTRVEVHDSYQGDQMVTRSKAKLLREHAINGCFVELRRNHTADCLAWLSQNNQSNENNKVETSQSAQNALTHVRSRRSSIASTSLFSVQNAVVETGFDYLPQIRTSIVQSVEQFVSPARSENELIIETSDADGIERNDAPNDANDAIVKTNEEQFVPPTRSENESLIKPADADPIQKPTAIVETNEEQFVSPTRSENESIIETSDADGNERNDALNDTDSETENDCWYLAEEDPIDNDPTNFIAHETVDVQQTQKESDAVDVTQKDIMENRSDSSALIVAENSIAMVIPTNDENSNGFTTGKSQKKSANELALQNNFDPFRRLPNVPFHGRPRSMSMSSAQTATIRRRSSTCMAIPNLETIVEEIEFGDDIESLFD